MSIRPAAGLWSRRRVAGALLAGAIGGCALPRREPVVSINLADAPPGTPPPPPVGDKGVRLETAHDLALRMTVPVHVDGRGPYAFVVDTGANRSVVSTELAAAGRLPSAGAASLHGIAGLEPAALVAVKRLRVGSVVSTNLRLPVLTRARMGADGLLGIDVLRNRRVRLNFRRNAFEISASNKGGTVERGHDTRIRDPDAPVVVPARYRSGQLVILDAEVGGLPVIAFLDSGSQITVGNLALRDAALRSRPELAARLAAIDLISATGQTAAGQLATLPRLRLGGLGLANLTAAFADLHVFNLWGMQAQPAILIGVDVMRHFDDIVLDFGRRQVTFWPVPRQRDVTVPRR